MKSRILLALVLALAPALRAAAPAVEIEALLHYVATLDGATFIRNGSAHTPAEAEAHLRLKWDRQKDQVVTAEDFIRLCATQSSVSGQPYLIRFRDGREEEAAIVLTRRLATLRHPPDKKS